jgi:aminobenzoyl-glutamate utilization protein B
MTDLQIITAAVDAKAALLAEASDKIWGCAELGFEETRSARLLCDILSAEGFAVTEGVGGMPTAFIARWSQGTGGPVMGLLGEFDALDALSQQAACPEKSPITPGAPGHGCGHNALGVGALGGALGLKAWLLESGKPGTVVYFGCPAEEGAGSKQFMARAGCFDGVDFCYTWHPGTLNGVDDHCNNAISGTIFTFDGKASHAGGAPHLRRSALDACELMSVGVNYLREHMTDASRVHYAYLDVGGTAANVVQDHAVVKYEVRAPFVDEMMTLLSRVIRVAEGAAHMTETAMTYETQMAFSNYFPNDPLAQIAYSCMQEVGAPAWSEEDYALARQFVATYDAEVLASVRRRLAETYGADKADALLARPLSSDIRPYVSGQTGHSFGSTDVGDVGHAVPTLNINVATASIGNVGHSWQMVAMSGSAIAHKGMLTAAKMLALCCARTMEQPEAVKKAWEIVLSHNGGRYQCPLPDSTLPPVGKY